MVFGLAVAMTLPAMAALDNGSFEAPEVTNAAGWEIFEDGAAGLEWTVEWAGTFTGAPENAYLELHAGVNGWTPFEGEQYAELDTDWQGPGGPSGEEASVKISQIFDTMEGYNYTLAYAWSPRPGHNDNAMAVLIDGAIEANHSGSGGGKSNTDWNEESSVFLAGASTEIAFEETGTPDSLGMFLDDVSCEFCVSDETPTDLVYGRDKTDVGDITVTHDGMYIYVEFMTDEPWVVYKTHVEIAAEPGDFPQNKGGLIPGKFTYGSGPYVPGVDNDTIVIPIPDGPDTYYLAFHAELLEISEPGYYWATGYDYVMQGLRKDGSPVLESRSDPDVVLGAPDGSTAGGGTGFFSLGFGGSIVVEFDGWVYNSNSPYEFAGVEITGGGSYPEEKAKVEFYYDGDWYLASTELTNQPVNGGDPKTFTYVQLPDGIPYAEKVRITDTTDSSLFGSLPDADGYDLDAVKARKLVLSDETGWGFGTEVGNNWSMYFAFDFNCPEDPE